MRTLEERLDWARAEAGDGEPLSRRQLCTLAGLTTRTVRTLRTAAVFSVVLGVRPEWLVYGVGELPERARIRAAVREARDAIERVGPNNPTAVLAVRLADAAREGMVPVEQWLMGDRRRVSALKPGRRRRPRSTMEGL